MASQETSDLAKSSAERLEQEQPGLVVSRMTKALRPGKVLIDWSQNNAAKTTVAPYSLRARAQPTVSTPVSWDEVERCKRAADLVFTADDVVARVAEMGDLFAATLPSITSPERARIQLLPALPWCYLRELMPRIYRLHCALIRMVLMQLPSRHRRLSL